MVNIGELSSISVNRPCSTPTHLLYGDDILLFCQCTSKNIRNIVRFLSFYGGLSSQIVNMNKSFMYFGKFVSNVRRWKLSFDASMKISQLHFIYLGVYLFQGAPKACFLRSVADFILSFFFILGKIALFFMRKWFVWLIQLSLVNLFILLMFINGLCLCWILLIRLLEILFGQVQFLERKLLMLPETIVVCLVYMGVLVWRILSYLNVLC